VIGSTGDSSWETVGQEWDIPRLEAWRKSTNNWPPLMMMVGHYLGYKPPEPDTSKMTTEQHAQRLMDELGVALGGGT
jgi:hypothetical protein